MIMQSLQARNLFKIRANNLSKSQLVVILNNVIDPYSSPYGDGNCSPATSWLPSRAATTFYGDMRDLSQSLKESTVLSFKEWFKSRNDALFVEIFKILRTATNDNSDDGDDVSSGRSADLALSNLGLKLDERFVLNVLSYGRTRKDVLSCLKFFDWAGRQPGFHHTHSTFHAIFKILSRAKLMSLMLDSLDSYTKHSSAYRVRFHSTLVMGYAVAGKPEFALQLFSTMRFHGIDLDSFGYNVLLNALVENSNFDAVKEIFKQIQMRGFDNEVTCSVMMKSFCKQKLFDEAEAHLREMVCEGRDLNGYALHALVGGLCANNEFDRAKKLIEEFQELGTIPMMQAYDVWLKELVHAGRLDAALEFLKKQKTIGGYVPDMFRYNMLICRLLWENRLEESCELLIEMKESKISPDDDTMNAALCFFCKAGMLSSALDLYNSRSEFGLSLNSMAYNYLINTLCGDGSIDQAFSMLQDSIDQGYFPGRKVFSILADVLCREGKLEKMKELLLFALDRNMKPSRAIYDKFISALCKASRLEDGYLIYQEINELNEVAARSTYFSLIESFSRSNRGDIAARLLFEMQERGYKPHRILFSNVISSLCRMENPKKLVLELLELHLSRVETSSRIYNLFIYGAGHAKIPELAREVYEMILRSGREPSLSSDILMLQSYLKSDKILDAVNFFNSLRGRRNFGRKLCNAMVTGLCRANRLDIALEFFKDAKNNGVIPSIECYELLIKLLCSKRRYSMAITLVNEFEKTGRVLTPFIGNTLLCHSLQGQELYDVWIHRMEVENENYENPMLGLLIGVFCSRVKFSLHIDKLVEVIEKCFPVDLFTYNLLLRKLSLINIDHACEMFHRMRRRGYEPNQWTYDILVRGFLKHGRKREAAIVFEEMLCGGFHPSQATTMSI